MLDIKDFKISKFNSKGLGGNLELLTLKTNKSVSYVVKSDKRFQSINEFVAQHLLKALGFCALSSEIIMYGRVGYGVVEYRSDIKRIQINNTETLTYTQKCTLVELFLLNAMLSNPDAGEYYLTSNGNICSLDYGEAIVTEFILYIYLSGKSVLVKDMMKYNVTSTVSQTKAALEVCKEHMLSDGFTLDDIERSAVHLFERFKNFDMSLMDDCFRQIDSIHFVGASDIYKNRIEEIIKTTSEIEI